MKKLLFVYNPKSGAGAINKKLNKVVAELEKGGYEVDVYATTAPLDGERKLIEDATKYDRIVVAGGDGMLNELVNAVVHIPQEVDCGYIPVGTVNDFAKTHKISKNPVKAARIAVGENVKTLDVGKFGDRYFGYVAAFGFGSAVSYTTSQKAKKRWKVLAYAVNLLKGLNKKNLRKVSRQITVIADGKKIEGNFVFGAISNSFSVASMKNLTEKHSVLDDGLLEGVFIHLPKGFRQWCTVLNLLLFRKFHMPTVEFVRAKHFELTVDSTDWTVDSTDWTLDGEFGGTHEDIAVDAVEKKLRIALPVHRRK